MAQTSVTLEHISKSFGPATALADINLSVAAGEVFFLLGPSGCGKSTLLRIVAGLLDPSAGRVLFNDRDVTPLSTEKRNAVMCFQSYALWPHMTVRENVRFGLEVRRLPRPEQTRRAAAALDLVRMTDFADRKPNELSGGQQQRVALARALVVEPDCLLLDEPLSNLDASLRLEMRTEIRRICRASGLTALYVTHDQKEALSIADRMAVLRAGRIEQVGRPQDLYRLPANTFVAGFMGETNLLPATVRGPATLPTPANLPAPAPAAPVDAPDTRLTTLDTPIGPLLTTTAPAALAPGAAVTLSLRPEAFVVRAPSDAASHNTFSAAVHDTTYLGEVAQHQITITHANHPTTLKAFELNPRILARDQSRQQAQVFVHPRDVVVLVK